MTSFAQALARIEELLKQRGASERRLDELSWKTETDDLESTLLMHADSIVQLGKVAVKMRNNINLHTEENWPEANWPGLVIACEQLDRLMKGEGE